MATAAHTPEGDEEKVNILVVDDRADKMLAHEVVLAELNQNMVRATSGKEALRCLLKQDFAVILLDVNMPGMDGFETAALIRQRARSETTPIIFISAVNDTENHVSRGYSLGAVDYILTPVVPEILRAKIAVFVDLFRKTEQIKRQAEERAEFIREQAARAEAEARQERLAFLAEAGNALAGSLDFQETFQNLARLVVPRLADFCIIDVADDEGNLEQVAVSHFDPSEEPKLRALTARYPGIGRRHGATHVFVTGKSEMCCDVTEEVLRGLFEDAEDRKMIRALSVRSFMAVPLKMGERVLGAITMVNTRPERACGPNELSLAEELAPRAALALENAGLYKAAQKARMDAERANLAKDQFLAMLSHELRTPLTPVLTSLFALEHEGMVADDLRPTLEMIRRNVELEARLIDDLLDLTRVSKGKVQLNLEIVDAHSLLRSALEICQSDIEDKQLRVSVDLAAEKVQLEADPARMQQIFWNLIKNAVKFTPEGGRLEIRTTDEPDDHLRVEISDSGVGIDPESLPKIFDAFEQGERMRYGGLGLGLAISKSLVETHHGRMTAQSAGRDQGATFTLLFPVSAGKKSAVARSKPLSAAERKSVEILLVEDHVDTNRSLTHLLRHRGYRVHPAHSVQSALDLAAKEHFDVLVSDIGLPDGTGTDLMRKLTAAGPVFGIALSGFGMEDDIRRSHDSGFNHHLVKPVDLNKLDSLLQDVSVG